MSMAGGIIAPMRVRRLPADLRRLVLLVCVGSAVVLPIVLLAPQWSLAVLPAEGAGEGSVRPWTIAREDDAFTARPNAHGQQVAGQVTMVQASHAPAYVD